MNWKLSLFILITGQVLGLFTMPSMAQVAPDVPAAAQAVTESEKYTLQWNLRVGKVFRVEHRINTRLDSQSTGLEQECRYYWTVKEVDSAGNARLQLHFDRAVVRDPELGIEFDSALDAENTTHATSNQRHPLVYEARALLASEVELLVKPDGANGVLKGAESFPKIQMFTPGDWPALPKHPVGIGESWQAPVGATPLQGESLCTLKSVEVVDGQRIASIETMVTWKKGDSHFLESANVEVLPSKSTSRFNLDAGAFVDERSESQLRVLKASEESGEREKMALLTETVRVEQSRGIVEVKRPPQGNSTHGQFIKAGRGGQFETFVVAGESVRKKDGKPFEATEMFEVDFYHDWKDDDQDGVPSPWELLDVSTRFRSNERIRFLLTMVGIENRKVQFAIVDAQGTEINGGPVRVTPGRAALAVREVSLPAGVYFFEYFIDGKFELRVPVRVSGD